MKAQNTSSEAPSMGEPTTPAVASAIENLRTALRAEYGDDFAFKVCARGDILGASNRIYGAVLAAGGGPRVRVVKRVKVTFEGR